MSPRTGVKYSSTYPLWAEQLVVRQRAMWRTYANDPKLNGLAIAGPALSNALPTNSAVLVHVANIVFGNTRGIQPYLSHGNYHVYNGQAAGIDQLSIPSWHIDQKLEAMQVQAPDRPYICSELGMHNALASTNTNFSAHTETAAGIYAPRLTLEHLYRGCRRHWYFELVDEYPNPSHDNQERQFGLFTCDWTPKPAAIAWKRLVDLFADPGPAFTPAGVRLSVSGPPMRLRTMLFRKRSGTALLALWRDVSVYNYVTKSDVKVAAKQVTVRLENPSRVRIHRPSVSGGVFKDHGFGVTSVDVSLTGDLVVVEIG